MKINHLEIAIVRSWPTKKPIVEIRFAVTYLRWAPLGGWAEGFHELNGYVFDLERDGPSQVVLCPRLTMRWQQPYHTGSICESINVEGLGNCMKWLVQLLFAQTNRRLNPTSKGLGCYLINIFNDSLVISQTDRHSDGVCGDPLITTDVALYDWLSRRLTELANVHRWMVWYSLIVWLIICCVNVLSDGLIEALYTEGVNEWPSMWVIGQPSDRANECD